MTSKKKTLLKNQSGTALVVALIMMVVITLIALASSYTSIFEIRISGNKRGKTNAFYSAEAGINAIQPYISNFDLTKYIPLIPSTTSHYNPFSDASIPNPTSAQADIVAYLNQTAPPRGGGWGQGVAYMYYGVTCIGNDTAGSGATSKIQQDIMRLVPVQ
jgi:Tfp pilus assembly protein PilX